MIETGKKAPAFALSNQDDERVKLRDLKGRWVVLYFYPKDNTPGCTAEACDFTAGIKEFEELGAVVVGCSPDSPESHRKFIARYGLAVSLLSDPDRTVMKEYGAFGEKTLHGKKTTGVIRSTVLIDPAGNVAHRWKKVGSAKGHAGRVKERLAKLAGN